MLGKFFQGQILIEDFITEEEELKLVEQLKAENWVPSQSGRMKLDYGVTKVNFKKRKVKTEIKDITCFPDYFRPFLDKIDNFKGNQCFNQIMKDFAPIELNILEYQQARGSHIAPHFDDFWIWGERILGLNLLQDTSMTFYRTIED